MTEMKARYVVWYERPKTGRFTLLDISEDVLRLEKAETSVELVALHC